MLHNHLQVLILGNQNKGTNKLGAKTHNISTKAGPNTGSPLV